jgi:hypothetical protein
MNLFGITLTTTDLWLLAAAGTLAVGLISYRLTASGSRVARHAAACSSFRSSVLAALEGLYPVPSSWPKDAMGIDGVLRAAFSSLQSAVAAFRLYVPWYHRRSFDRTWFIYRLGKDGREIDRQSYWQYIPSSGVEVVDGNRSEHDNTKTYKDDFRRNVDKLLQYAKKT